MKKIFFYLSLLTMLIYSTNVTAAAGSLILVNTLTLDTPDVFYPILGDSKLFSPRERAVLRESRRRVVELAKANKGTVFINGPTSKKAAALTFDDGPDSIITPRILDVLKANNVKASFFFTGNTLGSYPEIVKRTDREGHLVLSHSFSHTEFSKISPEEIRRELSMTEEKIYNLIGKRPAIVRPPYADLNQPVVNEISRNGYKIALWSIDTVDWSKISKDDIIKNVVDNVRSGDIISGHSISDKRATLEALPEIIKRLKAMGYTFMTLDELLGVKAYK